MKSVLFAFAVIAAVAADVSHLSANEYLPPVQDPPAPVSSEYIPPVQHLEHAPANAPAPVLAPAPVEPVPAHKLADDGYHYQTQRRVVYRRNRRDVSHLPLNEYLPPVHQEAVDLHGPTYEYLPPVQQPAPVAPVALEAAPVAPVALEAAPAHELADDGYHYKTQRRVVYRRNRRDVSHLPSNEYLPAAPEVVPLEVAPIREVSNAVVEEASPAHELADDGYRYKTNRRVVYRRTRRDVSHLVSNEYLPPVQDDTPVLDAPVQVGAPIEEAAPAHELADDGYHYKTQRRVVYRRSRRDVSHLPSNEYLPPVQQQEAAAVEVAPIQQVVVLDEAEPAHELADDGYHYKTQRRVVYRRNRRDVSHLPSNEYLPPVVHQQEIANIAEPHNDYLPPVHYDEPAPAHELAADGYHYKSHRRVVFRRH